MMVGFPDAHQIMAGLVLSSLREKRDYLQASIAKKAPSSDMLTNDSLLSVIAAEGQVRDSQDGG